MKKLYSFLFLLPFTFYLSKGFAQPVSSPDLKCLDVIPTGDVTLTWAISADPGGTFISYHIYSSLSVSGPYSLVDTVIPRTKNFYTHIGANATASRVYYLIQTFSNAAPALSAAKDTFSTLFLTVTNTGGNALLNWNKISNLPIPTSSGWYKIYRQYAAIWMLRDSTQNLTYTDITDVCNNNNSLINYLIEISDNTGCASVSNVKGDTTFTDNTPPVLRPIDTVSVNAANLATISWFSSPSPDADSVIIYKWSPTWQRIASVKVPQTFYTYPVSNAGNVSEMFRIAFKDSCGNLSPQSIEHQTIYLTATFDVCLATASLSWNSYINMVSSVNQYQVFRSMNGSPFSMIATTTATNYTDTGISLGNIYCYYIRATNGTKTSSSNRVCDTLNVAQPPQFNYNRFATVVSAQSITITAYVDTSPDVSYYRLQRATGTNGNFSVVLPATSPVGNVISWTDISVNAAVNSYSYKWEAMNSCNHVILSSDTATTMLLTASVAANLDVTLSWSDYKSWSGNVDSYYVYRAVDGVWNPTSIGTIPFTASGGTYTDDVSPFMNSKGIFSYYVVAHEGNGNTYGFKDSSASNIAKVFEYPKIYMPNAFTPNGDNINDVFIPLIGFIEPSDYTFTIFDNTGTPAWSTNNPAEGWDGKKKGHPCPEGVYMYLVQSKASNGDDSKIAGTVSLIR